FDYEKVESNEINLKEGDYMTYIDMEFQDEQWWFGKYNGESGLFPANYVNL
ncbi:hypothetical protein K469DRAFT_465602, partial [Zopfia rhizophila CBS 207.26]